MTLGYDGISMFSFLYLEFVTIAHVIWLHLLLVQIRVEVYRMMASQKLVLNALVACQTTHL